MTLVFLVCLISSPATCREERLNFAFEAASSLGCMTAAQPKMAEWANTHPEWRVTRWKCVPPGRDDHAI